jgi:PKD repeat protein
VVRFTVDLTGGTGAYSFARWTFGDGDSATGFNVSYTYAAPGNYTAALTVIDSANQTAADQVAIQVNASDGHSSPGGGGSMGLLSAWEIVAILLAVVVLVGFGVVRWWARGRTNGPRDDLDVESPRTGTGPPGPEGDLGAPSPETPAPASAPSPTFVEVVVPPAREAAPSLPIAPVAATESLGPALETTAPRTTPPPVDEPSGPRLKLSQRVMLHLYLQGHLADGEVAPVGFTQGGMADKLEVAQSPLSSVLRRLLVAGLVTQDTRHVRGQPRRLRVYRLTPVGDVVARDLYRQSLGEGESPPKVA